MSRTKPAQLSFDVESKAIRATLIQHAKVSRSISETGFAMLLERIREQHAARHEAPPVELELAPVVEEDAA